MILALVRLYQSAQQSLAERQYAVEQKHIAERNHQVKPRLTVMLSIMKLGIARFGILLLMSTLSACSLFETTTDTPPIEESEIGSWQEIEQSLRSQTQWEITGKIGIRTPEDSLTAAINNWSQDRLNYSIDLSSTFMGLGATKIIGSPYFITLYESGEEPVSSDQPDLLIAEALAAPLPIQYLPFWIKGIPAPNQGFELSFNDNGTLNQIKQYGWTIDLSKHKTQSGLLLPGKVKLTRTDTRIILAIKSWTLP